MVILEPRYFEDDRGYFCEAFNQTNIIEALGLPNISFVQDNESKSKKGVLRGLHFQHAPYGQGKLIRVIQGSIFDVAVDIRVGSPTFGKHVALELSEENRRQFWIPAGFAHGFVALEDDSKLLYKTTTFYNADADAGIHCLDPELGIDWPLANQWQLSEKDKFLPNLCDMKLKL